VSLLLIGLEPGVIIGEVSMYMTAGGICGTCRGSESNGPTIQITGNLESSKNAFSAWLTSAE
jgi:hypothetical protein